jgi:DNA-3-methyladenine glycosylase
MVFLKRAFFERSSVSVAQELLGKTLVWGRFSGVITETEAYGGAEDAASHGAQGITPRSAVMFGPPGFSYVYLIYGMYHCLNIVTEKKGCSGAALIRGLHLLTPEKKLLDGPGKLCRHLQITCAHNRIDLTDFSCGGVEETGCHPSYDCTPRIGVRKGQEKLWRFVIREAFL